MTVRQWVFDIVFGNLMRLHRNDNDVPICEGRQNKPMWTLDTGVAVSGSVAHLNI
jgi:hypothetical protein